MYEICKLSEYKEEIKKSRFHVLAQPVKSIDEAMQFIELNSNFSANHNCWAYKIRNDYRFNDDGEPSGTAGKPIFSAIEHADLTNIAVLIIRWFGGVKLGTGGLCRAYGGTASKCLSLADKTEIIEKVSVSISVPFEFSSLIYRILEKESLPKLQEEFTQSGLEVETQIPEVKYQEIQEKLCEATQGKAVILKADTGF